MSAFTPSEIEYLTSQGLARWPPSARRPAARGPGDLHLQPRPGRDRRRRGQLRRHQKWRDAQGNPKVTFLLDDVLRDPCRAWALEVRGRAEAVATGGGAINPRFPNFAEEFSASRPTRIVSWGLEDADGTTPVDFRVNSRPVG